jgi:hypothetical protein
MKEKINKYLKIIQFSAVIIFLTLFLYQCDRSSKLNLKIDNYEKEQTRLKNNETAALDTAKTYKDKNGFLTTSITAYQLTQDELKNQYSNLFGEFNDWKLNRPSVIIKGDAEIIEKFVNVYVKVQTDSLGGIMSIDTLQKFEDNNSRRFVGNIPYIMTYFNNNDSLNIAKDSINTFGVPSPYNANFMIKQNIKLYTGLSYNKEDKTSKVWIKTKYPNITFTEIVGADIIDNEKNKEALRKMRKNWGVGFSLGVGLNKNMEFSPYLGLGVNYTPKILRW